MRQASLVFFVLTLLPGKIRADEEKPVGVLARVLEASAKRAASDSGQSIAYIRVLRSDAYRNAPFWGVAEPREYPGQLGKFDAEAAKKRVPLDARNRARILQNIEDHDLSDPRNVPESYGNGFVIDRGGFILTNEHVVRDATKIFVRLPKNQSSWADVHATDPYSDLAVLRLLDPPADLKPLPLGDGGAVKTGQFILTLAHECSPRFRVDGPSIHVGEITNLRRKEPSKNREDEIQQRKRTLHANGTLFQINAEATPPCSGSAVLNLDGKVIGMTSALVAIGEKNGFVIPFDVNTQRIIEVLKRGEEVEYGFLGVNLNGDFDGGNGVFLGDVFPGTPAGRAGLQGGDHIVAINDRKVRRNSDLFLGIGMALAGTTVKITVKRGGDFQPIYVKLAKFDVAKAVIAAKRPPARFGLRVDYISILSQRQVFFPRWGGRRALPPGVIVREVIPGSPADLARLQPEKVITGVNGRARHHAGGVLPGNRSRRPFRRTDDSQLRTTTHSPDLAGKVRPAMRYAICNETFEGWEHAHICKRIASLGYQGLEIAPFTLASRITEVSPERRREWKRQADDHGITLIGLHWLLAKTTGLHLTSMDPSVRQATADYLVELARACADWGGDILVFGSPAQRRIPAGATREQAADHAVDTFRRAAPAIGDCGVKLCLEPLSPPEADFITTAREGLDLIGRIDHPAFRLHLDVKAMSTEDRPTPEIIRSFAEKLYHFHANDPNRRGPGFGSTDFVPIFQALADVKYQGWVSVEVFDYSPDPETIARESIRYMRECEAKVRR